MACRRLATLNCSGCTLSINADGNIVSFGNSHYGAHGHQNKVIFPPQVIPTLKNITVIASNGFHSVCLDYEGNVYTFGSNKSGELGIGVKKETLKCTHIPQKVNLPPCMQVACGSNCTLCLTEEGLVFSFGNNDYGQLGLGNTRDYNTPQRIESLKDIEFIECAESHVFCKSKIDEVFCWGLNSYGQLGLEHIDNQNIPALCSSISKKGIIDIKCGNAHTLVLTSNGDVLSSGDNDKGQLGRDIVEYASSFQKIEDLSKITRIECGDQHSVCINTKHEFFVFGWNRFGQLGLGDTNSRKQPIKHPSLSNIIDVSSNGRSTFVKTINNEIFAFGDNGFSQLGIEADSGSDNEYAQFGIVLGHNGETIPIRVFQDNEDIWSSNIGKSNAKSARK